MVHQVSLNGIQGVQSSGNSAVAGASGEYLNSIFGGTNSSTSSTFNSSMKAQIKSQAQELIKKSKNLKTKDAEGNEKTNKTVKKSIDKKMKALKEQAELAGVDLSDTFAELSENMSTKERKTLSKNLGVKIPNRKNDTSSTTSTSQASQSSQQYGSFGNITTTNTNSGQAQTNTNFFSLLQNQSKNIFAAEV